MPSLVVRKEHVPLGSTGAAKLAHGMTQKLKEASQHFSPGHTRADAMAHAQTFEPIVAILVTAAILGSTQCVLERILDGFAGGYESSLYKLSIHNWFLHGCLTMICARLPLLLYT